MILNVLNIQHKIDNIARPFSRKPNTTGVFNFRWDKRSMEAFCSLGLTCQRRLSHLTSLDRPVDLDKHTISTISWGLTSHLAWHLIGSRNCVPSSWRQGVTSPSQVHSPMTICPQPQAQGRRRGLWKNPNQERYNLNQSNSPVSLEIMLCCSQVCWCLLETGMLTLHPKQNDNGFSWFKTSSYVYWNWFL